MNLWRVLRRGICLFLYAHARRVAHARAHAVIAQKNRLLNRSVLLKKFLKELRLRSSFLFPSIVVAYFHDRT